MGSREELELRVEEATKKVDVRSETRVKKEEERAGLEELVKEHVKRAHSGGRALEPKQNPRGASEVVLLKAQLGFRKQALINLRQADLRHREEAERERDRLTQELLEARAGNETLGSGQRYSKISPPRPRQKIKVWRSLAGVLMLGSYHAGEGSAA